jgi:type IV secretory pathway VirB10-like protein
MIGYIYENKLAQYDSAYSVYKLLKEKFPNSLYTQRINSKLIAYESELQKKEMERKAAQDSLEKKNETPELKPDENENIDDGKKEEPVELKTEEPVEKKIEKPAEIKSEEPIKPDSSTQEKQPDNRRRRR